MIDRYSHGEERIGFGLILFRSIALAMVFIISATGVTQATGGQLSVPTPRSEVEETSAAEVNSYSLGLGSDSLSVRSQLLDEQESATLGSIVPLPFGQNEKLVMSHLETSYAKVTNSVCGGSNSNETMILLGIVACVLLIYLFVEVMGDLPADEED